MVAWSTGVAGCAGWVSRCCRSCLPRPGRWGCWRARVDGTITMTVPAKFGGGGQLLVALEGGQGDQQRPHLVAATSGSRFYDAAAFSFGDPSASDTRARVPPELPVPAGQHARNGLHSSVRSSQAPVRPGPSFPCNGLGKGRRSRARRGRRSRAHSGRRPMVQQWSLAATGWRLSCGYRLRVSPYPLCRAFAGRLVGSL